MGLLSLVYSIVEAPTKGWTSSVTLATFAAALFFLTQYLQLVLGYTPCQAGARTLPVDVGLVAGSVRSAPMNVRLGTRLTVTCGMVLAAGGLAFLTGATPTSGYGRVLGALLLAGAGSVWPWRRPPTR